MGWVQLICLLLCHRLLPFQTSPRHHRLLLRIPSPLSTSRLQRQQSRGRRYLTHRSPHGNRHFSESTSLASRLKSRSVIRFAGPDAVKFLQGLLTNEVRRSSAPQVEKPSPSRAEAQNTPTVITPPVCAALLTPLGRFLYGFFLYKRHAADERLDQSGSGPGPSPEDGEIEVFAYVDSRFLEEIVQTFKKYVRMMDGNFIARNAGQVFDVMSMQEVVLLDAKLFSDDVFIKNNFLGFEFP